MPRIVVTGLGAVTSLGNDPLSFWEGMKEGRSGAHRLEFADYPDFPVGIACEVQDFEPADWMDARQARRLSRASQFSLATAKQALEDAGLDLSTEDPSRIGVAFNTGGGGMTSISDGEKMLSSRGPRAVSPFIAPNAMPNCVASLISIDLGLTGPVITSALACASGNYSLLEAAYILQRGDADVIFAGGTESAVTPVIVSSFSRMGALSTHDDPTTASRPFDKERDGLVFGEGAGGFVIETEEHARARGARIYAEVLGGGLTADGHHLTSPEPTGRGAAAAMTNALRSAERNPDEVDVIYAHATATPLGDVAETLAIKRVLKDHAYEIPISATKSQIGHTFGAAGALAAIAAIYAIGEGVVCPTINYTTPDPECDLDCVPNEAREVEVKTAVVNAFGFGGQNVALVLGAYD